LPNYPDDLKRPEYNHHKVKRCEEK